MPLNDHNFELGIVLVALHVLSYSARVLSDGGLPDPMIRNVTNRLTLAETRIGQLQKDLGKEHDLVHTIELNFNSKVQELQLEDRDMKVRLNTKVDTLTKKHTKDMADFRYGFRSDVTQLKNAIQILEAKAVVKPTTPRVPIITTTPGGIGNDPAPAATIAYVNAIKEELDKRIDNFYANATGRLWQLENKRVRKLENNKETWRNNFKIIKNTFERMKKSGAMRGAGVPTLALA